jgi:3-deoxy-7-phosphoheptulonate synthase
VPAASEFLDVISPQYIGDLIAWGAIGARTTESQVHRELASGLSAPIGFKNGTDGNIKIATDAIQAAARGTTSCRCTRTARWRSCRPRATRTATSSCAAARRRTTTPSSVAVCGAARGQAARALMVDFSHANSSKQHERQSPWWPRAGRQMAGRAPSGVRRDGRKPSAGRRAEIQPGQGRPTQLEYGQSITDACIDWAQTEGLLAALAAASQA